MTTNKSTSDLADTCRELAGCLSYNEDHRQAEIKRALKVASHSLDSSLVRVSGRVVANARGKSRRLLLRERLAIWLLQGKTEIRP